MSSEHKRLRDKYSFRSPDEASKSGNAIPSEKVKEILAELWGTTPDDPSFKETIMALYPKTRTTIESTTDNQRISTHRIINTSTSIEGTIAQEQ